MTMRRAAIGWLVAGAAWLGVGMRSAAPAPAAAQTRSPYSEFQKLLPGELDSLQVKLTWVGPMDRPIETLVFLSPPGRFTPAAFDPCHLERWKGSYGIDAFAVITARISPTLLQALVDSVATLPRVVDGDRDSLGCVSFALFTSAGGTRCFETILGESNCCALARMILPAVAPDSVAFREMTACAYRMAMLCVDDPKDISTQVAFRVEPFHRIGTSALYETQVHVTNTSHAVLRGRFSLIPNVRPAGAELVNATDWTYSLRPQRPYLDYPRSTDALAPGATLEFMVRVRDDGRHRLRLNPRLYAGWGVR